VKITIVTLYNPFEKIRGGIESVVYHLSRAFVKLKHEVWVLTMGDVQKNTIIDTQGVNVWILPDRKINNLFVRNLLFIKKGKSIVEKMERECEIDVFNGQSGYSDPLFFADLKNAKRILTVHTIDGENIANIKDCWRVGRYSEFIGEALKYPILKARRSFYFGRADALIFVSHFALNEFKTFYPYLGHKPCHVIENGVPELSYVNRISTHKKNYDFVYAGRIDKRKGVDLLIKAANLLRKKHSFKIAVVGDGPWRKFIEELAVKLDVADNFHFFGYLNNDSTIEIFKTARCLVLPSFYESDPLVVKECMALGTPIIGSDIPSLREKILNYRNGLTFRYGDYQDLAKVMQTVLSSGRDAERSDKKTFKIRSWEDVAKEYIGVFKFFSQGYRRKYEEKLAG